MPLHFRKHLVADERYESAGVMDVNGDGVLDIVSGEWWYEGPDFRRRHRVGDVEPAGDYFDDFGTVPLDVNGDGRPDFVTGGWWGKKLRWRENPGDPDTEWPLHDVAETGSIETLRGWDIDGDGIVEILANCPGSDLVVFKLKVGPDGKGTGEFSRHVIHTGRQGHGLGAGDIAGNGRCDLVLARGWLEAPEDPYAGEWVLHEEFDLGSASVPILVADVNGDGLADLIVGHAHGYGLSWWEQRRAADGSRDWVERAIDPWNSQYHDMHWVDIDGDGQNELLTGKRYRAHSGKDPGSTDPYGIYYFKWTGERFSKQVIEYGPPRETTGIGIYSSVVDLSGNGLPDIVAPGKDGLYVFYNEGLGS